MLIDLGPEKVTSIHARSAFAELDPDCFDMVRGAGESFGGGAEACQLSLTWPRRLPPTTQHVCSQSQGR